MLLENFKSLGLNIAKYFEVKNRREANILSESEGKLNQGTHAEPLSLISAHNLPAASVEEKAFSQRDDRSRRVQMSRRRISAPAAAAARSFCLRPEIERPQKAPNGRP
jgi:hypothetical protein